MEYLVLIHGNAASAIDSAEWTSFFEKAHASGLFRGGSELGSGTTLGNLEGAVPTDHLAGYMRFDAEDRQTLLDLLEAHPVVVHGGTIEVFELPRS